MDIGAAVIELWEEEAPVGHFYQPVADAVFDVVGLYVVVQACLGEFDGADAAEDVVVDLIGEASNISAPSEDFPGMS